MTTRGVGERLEHEVVVGRAQLDRAAQPRLQLGIGFVFRKPPRAGFGDVVKMTVFLVGVPDFRSPDTFGYLRRDMGVALRTGSPGEPRAALARFLDRLIADEDLVALVTPENLSRPTPCTGWDLRLTRELARVRVRP